MVWVEKTRSIILELVEKLKKDRMSKGRRQTKVRGEKASPPLGNFCTMHPYSLTSTPTKFLELKFIHLSIHSLIHSFTFNHLFIVHHYMSSTVLGTEDPMIILKSKKQTNKQKTLVLLEG